MKVISTMSFFLIATLNVVCQEYTFPLYFEDVIGNKDTLYFGFNPSGTFEIDENLGEVNLIGQSADTTFFAFFTDALTKEDGFCDMESVKSPSYISKVQNINFVGHKFMEAGLIAKKWPVRISWNQSDISVFESAYPVENMRMLLTGWHPPGGWFDAVCCGSFWPSHYTLMSDNSYVEIDSTNICHYISDLYNNKTGLFYIGFEYVTHSENLEKTAIKCWYNSQTNNLSVKNIGEYQSIKVEIYNVYGKRLYNNQINSNTSETIDLNIELQSGIFIVKVTELNSGILILTHKIYKK